MLISTSDKKAESPPHSPHTSGGSTPKSPITPTSPSYFDSSNSRKRSSHDHTPVNGLPPPIPISDEELIIGAPPGANEPIIPPPQEFVGSSEGRPGDENTAHRGVFDNWTPSPTHAHTHPGKQREVIKDDTDGGLGLGPVLVQLPPTPLLFQLAPQVCMCLHITIKPVT